MITNVWHYLPFRFNMRAQRICGDVFVLMNSGLMAPVANDE